MSKQSLTPQDWISAGLQQLVSEGPQALRAEALARHIKTTKGSFYWHFKDVPAFHAALLETWQRDALGAVDALKDTSGSVADRLISFGQMVQGNSAEPALRAWAQADSSVADVLTAVDTARRKHLESLMKELGSDNSDATLAAYGALIGLRIMRVENSDALVAYAAYIDMAASAA